jgi:hypothetical protein
MIQKYKDFQNILSKMEMKTVKGGWMDPYDTIDGGDDCIAKGKKCSYSEPKECCSKKCNEGKPESGYQCG